MINFLKLDKSSAFSFGIRYPNIDERVIVGNAIADNALS